MLGKQRFKWMAVSSHRSAVSVIVACVGLIACTPEVAARSEASGSIEGFIRERLKSNDWLCGLHGSQAEKQDVFRFSKDGTGYLVGATLHRELLSMTSELTVSFRWSVSDTVLTLSDQKVQSYVAKIGRTQPTEMKDLLKGRSATQWFTVDFSGSGLLMFANQTFTCERR